MSNKRRVHPPRNWSTAIAQHLAQEADKARLNTIAADPKRLAREFVRRAEADARHARRVARRAS